MVRAQCKKKGLGRVRHASDELQPLHALRHLYEAISNSLQSYCRDMPSTATTRTFQPCSRCSQEDIDSTEVAANVPQRLQQRDLI